MNEWNKTTLDGTWNRGCRCTSVKQSEGAVPPQRQQRLGVVVSLGAAALALKPFSSARRHVGSLTRVSHSPALCLWRGGKWRPRTDMVDLWPATERHSPLPATTTARHPAAGPTRSPPRADHAAAGVRELSGSSVSNKQRQHVNKKKRVRPPPLLHSG